MGLVLKKNLEQTISAKSSLLSNDVFFKMFDDAVELVYKSYKLGGRLLIAGNGGSAADAQHLAAEFVSKLYRDRIHCQLLL